MGKKTISEKNKIRKNLDILMNLPQAIIDRNPKIKAFIKATQTITTGSFTTVAFDLAVIASLSSADQSVVADSMIVRNIITPQLVVVCYADPGDIYVLYNTDYENDDVFTFLRKAVVLDIINHYF